MNSNLLCEHVWPNCFVSRQSSYTACHNAFILLRLYLLSSVSMTAVWCSGTVLCLGVSRYSISCFLLEDLCLCISHHASTCWNTTGIPDKKSQTSRSEGLQVHSCHYLYIKCNHCSDGACHPHTGGICEHWHWHICIWYLGTDNYTSHPHICPKSED